MSKTTIVLDVFRAADNAGILMESVCEHFGISAEAAFSCAQRENKAGQIDKILADAEQDNRYGGSEDRLGSLQPGLINWSGLRAKIAEILAIPPLTAPAPLTDKLKEQAATTTGRAMETAAMLPNGVAVTNVYEAYEAGLKQAQAAPAPQQSESIDSIANELEDAAIPYEGDFADTVRSCVEGLRDLAAAKAAPAAPVPSVTEYQVICASGDAILAGMKPGDVSYDFALVRNLGIKIDGQDVAPAAPVQTAEPKRIPDMLTVEAIQGAIAFGRMGINPPPSPDHWGNEFWQIGRQLAKLSETSAWDNVTPVDVAAPVQAEQAQAEPVNVAEMVNRFLGWKLPKDFSPDCGIIFDGRGPDTRGYDRGWPTGTNLFHAGQAKEMFEHCLKGAVRPTDDDLWDQTLRERDHNADMADKLAEAIGKHFGIEIGEHSNMNCPWQTALDWIENESTHAEMQAAAAPAQAEQAAAVRAAEWVSVMDRLPANQEAVLVMSDSWSRPAVLVYSDRPYQRFMDRRAGQWFWYPERMHWMPLPQAPGNRTQSTGQTSNDTGALGDTGGTE